MGQFYPKHLQLNKDFFLVCLILLCFGRKVGIRIWTPSRADLVPGSKYEELMGSYPRNKGGSNETHRRKK